MSPTDVGTFVWREAVGDALGYERRGNSIFENLICDRVDEKLRPIDSAAGALAQVISDKIGALQAGEGDGESIISKNDIAMYKELTATLKNLSSIIRDVNDIQTSAERRADELAYKKLELEKNKKETADSTVTFVLDEAAKEFAK